MITNDVYALNTALKMETFVGHLVVVNKAAYDLRFVLVVSILPGLDLSGCL